MAFQIYQNELANDVKMMFFFNIDVEIIYEIFIYSSILNIKK